MSKTGERTWEDYCNEIGIDRATVHRWLERYIGNKTTAHVSHNSGENEWYTPPAYIEAAREVMGDIDLDPASSAAANKIVGAKEYYTKKEDGLKYEWKGRVWMNPPYAQPLIEHFSNALVDEQDKGNVHESCVLVNNATETEWFQNLAESADAICFPSGRVKFADVNGKPGAPLQGQAVVYRGPNKRKFKDTFSKFGLVVGKI